ncbi:hypothetical protein KJ693_01375 [bacterium]|nr:hypothetical protein [bacterium]MBU1613941.1 hypothetical protein [bacterium]
MAANKPIAKRDFLISEIVRLIEDENEEDIEAIVQTITIHLFLSHRRIDPIKFTVPFIGF